MEIDKGLSVEVLDEPFSFALGHSLKDWRMIVVVNSSGKGVRTRDLRTDSRRPVKFVSDAKREARIRRLARKYSGVTASG
ncbi:MAG: hypothetical protein ACYSX1_11115 [Planctomycetota bacterium]|jgi:hypothetical protein